MDKLPGLLSKIDETYIFCEIHILSFCFVNKLKGNQVLKTHIIKRNKKIKS